MTSKMATEQVVELQRRAMDMLRTERPDLDDDTLFDTASGMIDADPIAALDRLTERRFRLLAEAAGLKKTADDYALPLYDEAHKREEKAAALDKRISEAMQKLNIGFEKAVELPCGRKPKFRKNGNPSLVYLDKKKIPPKYLIPQDPKPDVMALKNALKDPALRHEVEEAVALDNAPPILTFS